MKKNSETIEMIIKIEFYTRGRFAVDGKIIYKAFDRETPKKAINGTRESLGALTRKLNKTNKIDPWIVFVNRLTKYAELLTQGFTGAFCTRERSRVRVASSAILSIHGQKNVHGLTSCFYSLKTSTLSDSTTS